MNDQVVATLKAGMGEFWNQFTCDQGHPKVWWKEPRSDSTCWHCGARCNRPSNEPPRLNTSGTAPMRFGDLEGSQPGHLLPSFDRTE